MKTTTIKKMFIGLTTFTSLTINSYAQLSISDKSKFENSTTKIDSNTVPKLIIERHYKEFPKTKDNNWYGYPKYSINTNWFDYKSNVYLIESPKYYIVEFTNDTILHRLTYNTLGERINTYKSIDAKIQTNIAKTLINSKYKNWEITHQKEELFRDLDLDKLIIYKVEVQKGDMKHYLFFTEAGLLIKDEEINF